MAESLLCLIEQLGFEPNDRQTEWTFDGHETQGCSVRLCLENNEGEVEYCLLIEHFPGGEGYEDERHYASSQVADLMADIAGTCAELTEPYTKTRLQKMLEPILGHDMAYALFHRPQKKHRR